MIIATVIRNCNRRLINNRNRSQLSFDVFQSHSSTSVENKRWFMTGGSKLKENTDENTKTDNETAQAQFKEYLKKNSESFDELYAKAKPRADAIYEDHIRLPTLDRIPNTSLPPGMTISSDDSTKGEEFNLNIRRKRLVYRAKQRGWLEVDLLLGTWASKNVGSLSSKELDEFERFINLETVDIYNIITLKVDIPEELKMSKNGEAGVGVVERIADWAAKSPLGKACAETYKDVKKEHNLI